MDVNEFHTSTIQGRLATDVANLLERNGILGHWVSADGDETEVYEVESGGNILRIGVKLATSTG